MSWRSAPHIGLLSILLLMVASVTVTYAPKSAFASGQLLISAYGPEASTTLDTVYEDNQIQFNYTSGAVWLSTCSDAKCTWAIDDDARISVVHQDLSTAQDDFESRTADIAAVDISYLLEAGTNTVTIELIDRIAPLRGLPRALYLVPDASVSSTPELSVESIPPELLSLLKLWIGYSKDPVNTLTGSFTLIQNDLAIAGRGPTPSFTRYYDSANDLEGTLGPGWFHNYETRLVSPDSMSDDIVVVTPTGSANYYTEDSGDYLPPDGVTAILVKEASGAYTVTEKDLTRWEYDQTGRLMRIRDRYGNLSVLTYNGSGQLSSVGDPAGRGVLTFTYDGTSGRLTDITDWASRVVSYGYDGSDRLETVTDRESNTTTFAYDSTTQRITTVTDANSHVVVTNTYDGSGRVSTQKDARGLTTSEQTAFTYTDTGGGTQKTTITYPATSHETGWDLVEEDYYDADGRLVQHVSKPLTSSATWITESYAYNADGFRISHTDGEGGTTLYCFDVDYSGSAISGSRGNVTRVIKPSPTSGAARPTTLYEFDTANNITQVVSPNGVTSTSSTSCATDLSSSVDSDFATDYVYDSQANTLTSMTQYFTDPDSGAKTATTKYEYNDSVNLGLPTKIITPRGNTTGTPNYSYATALTYGTSGTQAGMLVEEVSPVGAETTYAYDSVGRLTSMVEPRGNEGGATPSQYTWEYVYDDEDRLTFEKAPAPSGSGSQLVTEYRYDAVGNKTVIIDANGQVTVYDYDERDQLAEVHQSPDAWTNPASSPTNEIVTTYEYDHLYNLSRIIRADGSADERATDYAYDGLGRLITEEEYPSWPSTSSPLTRSYTYDKNGNRVGKTDANSHSTTYVFDALNRMIEVEYNHAYTPDVTYVFDKNGNRTGMADSVTGTTAYTYDEVNRLVTVTSVSGSLTVEYRYDLNGNRTKFIYPDDDDVDYTYDESDRMDTVVDWDGRITDYSYFANGLVNTITHDNGTSAHHTYDRAGRVTQIWNKYGTDTVNRHTYTLDDVGNVTHIDEVLTATLYPDTIDSGREGTIDYEYDMLYRVTEEDRDLDSPEIDVTYNWVYDDVNNITTRTEDFFFPDDTDYEYDKADRIVEATGVEEFTTDSNGNITARGSSGNYILEYDRADRLIFADDGDFTFFYDGDGKRIVVEEDNEIIEAFIYDVNRLFPVVIQSGETKIVWGLAPLYFVDGDDDAYVYHTDRLGSIRAVSAEEDFFGPALGHYAVYNAYGRNGDHSNRLKFAGEMQDEPTGYYDLRARFMDPVIGRFMNRDSYAGDLRNPASLNRYSYAENNPVNRVDPTGHSSSKALQNSLCSTQGPIYGGGSYVPCMPSGVDIEANIKLASTYKFLGPLTYAWFYLMVDTNQPWDYKAQGSQYEEFGNYHFGVVGKAAGIPLEHLLMGAGAVHLMNNLGPNLQGKQDVPIDWPFGDDRRDTYWVIEGYLSR